MLDNGIRLLVAVSATMVIVAGISAQDLQPTRAGQENGIANARMAPPLAMDRPHLTGRQLFELNWEWTNGSVRAASHSSRATSRVNSSILDTGQGDGLGPLYNATSCVECHVDGGGSDVKHNVTLITLDPRVRPGDNDEVFASELREVFPGLIAPGGVVAYNTIVHNYSTRPGYEEIRARLASHVEGGVTDEWFTPEVRTTAAIARQPVIAGRFGEIDFYLSQRNSPPLFGVGLIDGINPQRLANLAKQQASKSDGKITGRFAGKFGWQGQSQSLFSFVESACAGELGLNQPSLAQSPDHADLRYVNSSFDMLPEEVMKLTKFVSVIPRPLEVEGDVESHEQIFAGEGIFNSVGCVDCHVPDIHPAKGLFSDLLLHDMGDRLQGPSPAPVGFVSTFTPAVLNIVDLPRVGAGGGSVGYYNSGPFGRALPVPYAIERPAKPQFPRGQIDLTQVRFIETYLTSWDALQREWKTPPLWGVRDTGPYLHDGRADTIEEAIQWHGGEAEASRLAFDDLSRGDKDLVVTFLNSLRAPSLPDYFP